MKVLAINGSPNKEGNTWHALNMVGEELKNNEIDFEILHIGNKHIHGCLGCKKCAEHKDEKCSIKKDDLNKWLQMAKAADGLLIGSPVYYSGIAGTLKSFLDRLFYVSGSNGNLFRHKVGAAVIAVRRTGGSSTLDALNHYFTVTEMLIPGSSYWNIIHGRTPGEVEQDIEGKQALRVLGKNMAWLLKMKEATRGIIAPPVQEKKEAMGFIR
jgi:multimeric flavodoxin WrbA